MNKLEKGLIVVGALGSLLFTGLAISDVYTRLPKNKPLEKATIPVGLTSIGFILAGSARTMYNQWTSKNLYYDKPEDYKTKKIK